MNDLRYPIGKFSSDSEVTREKRKVWIRQIADTPKDLRAAVDGLSKEQLLTPYRPDGWTVCQVVHHVADSHLNSYIRFRLGLTEDRPLIKTYDQDKWANLPDAATVRIDTSLVLLEALHARWVELLDSLTEEDFVRRLQHPEWGEISLATNLQIYAWHGPHHAAQIRSLREREGW
jgi:uncharacterized damage-inducible protein DinB